MTVKRTLSFESITDGYVYDVVDSLNDKGEPTQQRLFVEKMAKQKVPVTGGAPGEFLPAYRLAKTPRTFSPHDPLDIDVLKDADGRWAFPSKKWKEEQEKRVGKRGDSARRAEEEARAHATNQVVEGLARLAMTPPPRREQRNNEPEDRRPQPPRREPDGGAPAGEAKGGGKS